MLSDNPYEFDCDHCGKVTEDIYTCELCTDFVCIQCVAEAIDDDNPYSGEVCKLCFYSEADDEKD